MRLALSMAALLLSATAALAEGPIVKADSLKWAEAPRVLPKGAQFALVSGDPASNGPYVLRLKMPAGYRVPAHNHPTSEYVTVLSGSFHIGMGDVLDPNKGQELRAGDFAEAPANMNHFTWTTAETVIQVHGQGPFEMSYVNPADDPRKTE